jgi:alkanesulfonate monooxygenase SsuD/methylene tetrahydromethanopterin reductase-like flavin-dependent oxidoreductase (luciferase family)
MSPTTGPRFGIMTAPSHVTYDDVVRVWPEADAIPQIEHAWLFDHLMPIGGDPAGPTFEGWTLLSALAAQTGRLRLGLLVTSNRFRPPAMLAKIAATVDVVSGGRLEFGIGVGSRPGHPLARREYEAHGLPCGRSDATLRGVAGHADVCDRRDSGRDGEAPRDAAAGRHAHDPRADRPPAEHARWRRRCRGGRGGRSRRGAAAHRSR